MKIQSLSLRDFRCFADHTIELKPDCIGLLVHGQNGLGKTTIAHALEFLFSGKNPLALGQADKLEDLVRWGAERATITLRPAGDDVVATRSVPPHTLSLTGSAGTGSLADNQARLEQAVGCTADLAQLCLRAGRFFGMTQKNQKDLVFEILGLRLTPDDVAGALEHRQEQTGLPLLEEARRTLRAITNDLGGSEQRCRDQRTYVGRDQKRAKANLETEQKRAEELVFKSAPDPAAIEAFDRAIRDLQDQLAVMERRQKELDRARHDVAKAREQVRQLELQPEDRPDDPARVEARLQKGEERLAQLRADLVEARKQHDLAQRAQRLRERLAELEAGDPGNPGNRYCPTCGTHLTDPEHYLRIDHQANTVKAELEQLRVDPDALVAPPVEQLERTVAKAETWLREQRTMLHAAQRYAGQKERLEQAHQQLTQVQARLTELEAEGVPDPSELLVRLRDQQEARAKLRRDEQLAREWTEHLAAEKRYADELDELTRRYQTLSELVHFYSPEGLRREMLAQAVDGLVAQLNQLLGTWGMAVQYQLPEVELRVRPRPGGPWLPYHRLSDGEQILVALAHQAWFARTTGLRIIVIDRLEALDARRQEALLNALKDLCDWVDHVIMLGVSVRVRPPEWVQCHQLEAVAEVSVA